MVERQGDLESSVSSYWTSSEEDSSDFENDPTVCSLCQRHDCPTITIGDYEELRSITSFIEKRGAVKKVRFACKKCLYKLYMVCEKSKSKTEHDHRLELVGNLIESMGSPVAFVPAISTVSVTPPCTSRRALSEEFQGITLDTTDYDTISSDNYETISSQDKEGKNISNGNQNREEEQENPEETEQANVEELKNAKELENQEEPGNRETRRNSECAEDEDQQRNSNFSSTSSSAHLDVLYERTESALITESGGTLDQYRTLPLQCRYCPKVFVLKKPYSKHMRSHHGKIASIRSSCSSRLALTSKMYACTDCSATFDTSAKLKTHCRIHLKRYYCSYCHKENLSSFDHEFHEAECKGEHMAKEEIKQSRRMTRSVARTLRGAPSDVTPRSGKSPKSYRSSKTSRSSRLKRKTTGKVNYADSDENENDDDDDDGATSVACTEFTGMHSYIENWVAGTCQSECGIKLVSNLKKPAPTEEDAEEEEEVYVPPVIVSQKEYDIIRLERLIYQSNRNVYSCNFPPCDYATNTLREMCLHEITTHKCKTHYFCRKCRGVFIFKVYYDFHMYMQNFGEYRCNKCTMQFNYEYQLQYHLLKHQESEAFPCFYCDNTFMSNQELRIHCLETGHDPKKRKKIISIDHSMTIANETESAPPPPKRTYKCTINIMNLPKMTDKRPMPIIWPKGKNMFLGDIDFEYHPGRNCVRTK